MSLSNTCSDTAQRIRSRLKYITSFIEDTVLDYDKYMSLLVKIRLEYAVLKLKDVIRDLETCSNT